MAYREDDFAKETNVSRETLAEYQAWHTILLKWNKKINLVSPTALDDFWKRHALDSWQLTPYMADKRHNYIDLGSGAGFPAIALAIAAKTQNPQSHVLMVESAGKKASFLRTVIRDLDLPASVTSQRAEEIIPKAYDVVSARAFAPLDKLLNYAQPFWGEGTIGLFLKGGNVQDELTEADKSWTYSAELIPSLSDSTGCIIRVTGLFPK